MPKDKKVDAYIVKSADFAQPILEHFRDLVHKTCPTAEEKIKWGFPFFEYNGEMLCHMAAFKKHCGIGFWKAKLMSDPKNLFVKESAAGSFGPIKDLKDLPSEKILAQYIKEAMKLTDQGIKMPGREKKIESKAFEVPDYFKKALSKNKKAVKTFENFSPSNKKEYVNWITEAKTEATRDKRMETAIEWMAEGKTRLWKYQK